MSKLDDLFKEEWFDDEGFLLLEVENRLAGFAGQRYTTRATLHWKFFAIAVDPISMEEVLVNRLQYQALTTLPM